MTKNAFFRCLPNLYFWMTHTHPVHPAPLFRPPSFLPTPSSSGQPSLPRPSQPNLYPDLSLISQPHPPTTQTTTKSSLNDPTPAPRVTPQPDEQLFQNEQTADEQSTQNKPTYKEKLTTSDSHEKYIGNYNWGYEEWQRAINTWLCSQPLFFPGDEHR